MEAMEPGAIILVVDDEPIYLAVLSATLGAHYKILCAGSAPEALAILAETRPDLILLDVMMPGMDGYDLCRRLKENHATAGIPVIFVTANDDGAALSRGLELGAVDYVTKPFNPAIVRLRVRNQLRLRNDALLSSVIDLSNDAIVWADSSMRVCRFNKSAELMFGYEAAEIIGQPVSILIPQTHRSPHERHMDRFSDGAKAGAKMSDRPYLPALRKDGTEFPAEISIFCHQSEDRKLFTATIRDMTIQQANEAELVRLASTDPLTGALNRRSFFGAAKAEIERAARYRLPLSIAMLDIDYFKHVNDCFGHAAGDLCLIELVKTLRGELRSSDLIGRYGGEEFALLLPQTAVAAALALGERIRTRVEDKPIKSTNAVIAYAVSIGIAPIDVGMTSDDALAHADAALYRAKETGRNRVCLWTEDFSSRHEAQRIPA
jgi:two-component system cell cycle response regulator